MRRYRSLIAVLPLVLLICGAVPAYGWEVSKATNGLIINRSVDDTATGVITVTRYWDYKGGDTWVASFNPAYSSSYTKSDVLNIDGNYLDGFELDAKEGFRPQLFAVSQAGAPAQVRFAILNEAAKVTVENTASVEVVDLPSVKVSSLPTAPVSVLGTVTSEGSLLGTVAVSSVPTSVADASTAVAENLPLILGASALIAAFAGVGAGYTLSRGA